SQVNGREIIDVAIEDDLQNLDEVIVVGYGTQLKEEISGAVSSISSAKMNNSTETAALGRIQGQVSGVTITNSSTPGGSASMRIRGLGTINDSNPLYVRSEEHTSELQSRENLVCRLLLA